MVTKKFGDKKIIIREPAKSDFKNLQKFQVFINSLVDEKAKILMNKRASLKDEKKYLEGMLEGMKNKIKVSLLAECDDKIVASTSIELEKWSKNHVGIFAIAISNGYRRIGLGSYLMAEIMKLAKKQLRPQVKIFRLDAHADNNPAIGLYKKMGFKIVGKIPQQIQSKNGLVAELIMIKKA